jgi:mannosyltransferase
VDDKTAGLFLNACLAVSVLAFAAYAVIGLTLGYSYWTDELFSVTTAIQPAAVQWQIVLNDVHPPLYQVLLSAWIAVAGSSELAARGLSMALVAAGLAAVVPLSGRFDRRLIAIFAIVLVSSWLVSFYGQEVRSYALLFCLAAWVFALFVLEERRCIFPLIVALGCTHFFGTLMAGLCLVWIAVENRARARVVLAAALCGLLILIWPMVFFLLGTGREVLAVRGSPAAASPARGSRHRR